MDTFLKMACHGHLTQVTSQAHKEQSRGQGGADMPDLNLRLVNDFTFEHDSLTNLTRGCSHPSGGVVPIPSNVEDSIVFKAQGGQKVRKVRAQNVWLPRFPGLSCVDSHIPLVPRKPSAFMLLSPAP